MRLKTLTFYRRFGVRRREQLERPRLVAMEHFTLPYPAILHFNPSDNVTLGPNREDPLVSGYDRSVFVEHVTELTHFKGSPRRTAINPTLLANDFRRKSRGFKPFHRDQALTIDQRNGLVINYAPLAPTYRYMVSFKRPYYEWANRQATQWDKVNELHQRFGWSQYLPIELPRHLPTLQDMTLLSSMVGEESLKRFTERERFTLFDLWQWVGEDREQSLMGTLHPEVLPFVNLVFRIKGYFFVLNVGVLDDFRKGEEDSRGLDPKLLQMRLRKLYQNLSDLQDGLTEFEVDDEAPTDEKTLRQEIDEDLLPIDPIFRLPEASPLPTPPEPLVLEVEEGAETPSVNLPKTDVKTQYSQRLVEQANSLNEVGVVTTKARDRIIQDAVKFTTLSDPFGSNQTIDQAMATSADDYTLADTRPLPDRTTVPDKSMLSSHIKAFHQKYTQTLLPKHVMQSVVSLQNLGLRINDYKIETVKDAMNHYQVHTVVVKPLKGRQSTLRFRLPVIDEDGRFVSNGQKNRMRLQRSDLPIRKVKPTQVALTSYYNKTFVERSSRKQFNYGQWLSSELTRLGLDDEDPRITNVRLSNVFDPSNKTPRTYAMVARCIRYFVSHEIAFFWDYAGRIEYFAKQGIDVTQVESEERVVIGHKGPVAVTMDMVGTIYMDGEPIGDLPEVCRISREKAPLEALDVTISNKSLPLGFVLGYQLGFGNLLSKLGCEVTRFRRGERYQLQVDEFELVFSDEVLVFTRQDTQAMFILAGLQRFHKVLKEFSVWDFNQKDVYFNLLASMDLGVRYLREIDTLFPAWVDPITRDLLLQMGEPTAFDDLLLRAVELLVDDVTLSEVDATEMRYRGYERMAGMVYGELMRSAKIFNSRPGNDHQVELKPHAVWQRIVQDPSVTLCEDVNPIQNLREQEVMTYRGDGGRSSQSMVQRTRLYSDADQGSLSESTQDSGDVGVVAYLSPNANLTSLFGTTRRYDESKDGPATLFSSSALNAPYADELAIS